MLIGCASNKRKKETYIENNTQSLKEITKKNTLDSVSLKTISIFTELRKENIDSIVVTPQKVIYYGIKKEIKQEDSIATDYKKLLTDSLDSSTSQSITAKIENTKEKDKTYYNVGFFFIIIFILLFVAKRLKLF